MLRNAICCDFSGWGCPNSQSPSGSAHAVQGLQCNITPEDIRSGKLLTNVIENASWSIHVVQSVYRLMEGADHDMEETGRE